MSGFIPDQSNEKATAGVALAARRKASDDHAGCAHGVNVILYGQYLLNTEDIRSRQPQSIFLHHSRRNPNGDKNNEFQHAT